MLHHSMARLEAEGYLLAEPFLTDQAITRVAGAIADHAASHADDVCGRRDLLAVPMVREAASSAVRHPLIVSALGSSAQVVRVLFFNKTANTNWSVPWHQDLSLALKRREEIPGWGPWSVKQNVPHASAPGEVLERMLTLRLHLDACGPENGPLRVLPGTHRFGRLAHSRIAEFRRDLPEHSCCAPRGALLLMRPLLLHASSSATQPSHRRVLHLELAPKGLLPPPLAWAEAI